MAFYLIFSSLISYLILLQKQATADTLNLEPRKANCTGGSYTQNSQFSANLAALLSSLTTQSSYSNSAIGNVTTGRNSADTAYGLFMCQGDITNFDCYTCISAAAKTIVGSCTPAATRQVVIWYDSCLLRYSDSNFIGVPDTDGFSMDNPNQKTSSTRPFEVVTDLVKAAPQHKPLMFASKALPNESLYALAQCTADLSTDGCSMCLTTILADIKNCCTQQQGWRYLANSCWVRYEATPFLNTNGASTEITWRNCSASTFSPNTAAMMESGIINLMSNLTVKAQPTGFYNSTIGGSANRLYGSALCRGDLIPPSNECNACLYNASRTITEDCPNSTEGIKWYEKCQVRYSNHNFFGVVDLAGTFFCGVDAVDQATSVAVLKLATSLAETAAHNPLMVAAGNLASSYVLLQCTRDLSLNGCKNCLQKGLTIIDNQCNQTNGWRYLSGSCTLRYETFAFFNTSAIASAGIQPPFPAPQGQEEDKGKNNTSSTKIIAIVVSVLGAAVLGLILTCLWWRLKRKNGRRTTKFSVLSSLPDTDLPLIDLVIIQAATNNFSENNKLGEGGFGPVYKGIIHGDKEIAVKRLSKKSKQGTTEFKNEVKLIAKLQHRNLVRMLGCCIEREEKLLVYEFLPNKSLDVFLFDPDKRARLDWNRRVHIISGIARGLLYLHEDSRLRVIHRDLKASNVLLDNEMNPKISDFGLAKIFAADENEDNASDTIRIVGT